MRVKLIATKTSSTPATSNIPLSLLICPAGGQPGHFHYTTDSLTLLAMLRRHTELNLPVLERFKLELKMAPVARLLSVNLSDTALTEIGYFTD